MPGVTGPTAIPNLPWKNWNGPVVGKMVDLHNAGLMKINIQQ